MDKRRFYSSSDVDMLTACAIVVNRAIDHKVELAAKRSGWTEAYFSKLRLKVDKLYNEQLGVNSNVEMRRATQEADIVRNKAINALRLLREELKISLRNEPAKRDEFLKQLGYSNNGISVRQKDVLEHLHLIKMHMTDELTTELKSKGIDATMLSSIVTYADNMRESYTLQKNTKGLRKEITQESVEELNSLYVEVSDICRLIRVHYPEDKKWKEKFCYQSILNNLKTASSTSQNTPAPSSDTSTDSTEESSIKKTA